MFCAAAQNIGLCIMRLPEEILYVYFLVWELLFSFFLLWTLLELYNRSNSIQAISDICKI